MATERAGRIARRGRPLRFLASVTTGWIGLRILMLWPQFDTAAAVLRAIAPVPIAAAHAAPERPAPATFAKTPAMHRPTSIAIPPQRTSYPPQIAFTAGGPGRPVALQQVGRAAPTLPPAIPRAIPSLAALPPRSHWSGSAWIAARGGSGISSGVVGGQLGGSQAGVRIAYRLDRAGRLALAGRVTTPLGAGLREAALGVEWQPTRLPLRIVAEQRIALGTGTGGPAIGVVGGVGPIGIAHGLRLEAYGQAGVIHRIQTEAYADGALHVAHPIGALGRIRFDLGAGVWGAVQRGAARLDLGPSLGVTLPLGHQAVRLAVDCGIMYQLHQAYSVCHALHRLMSSYAGRIRSDAKRPLTQARGTGARGGDAPDGMGSGWRIA